MGGVSDPAGRKMSRPVERSPATARPSTRGIARACGARRGTACGLRRTRRGDSPCWPGTRTRRTRLPLRVVPACRHRSSAVGPRPRRRPPATGSTGSVAPVRSRPRVPACAAAVPASAVARATRCRRRAPRSRAHRSRGSTRPGCWKTIRAAAMPRCAGVAQAWVTRRDACRRAGHGCESHDSSHADTPSQPTGDCIRGQQPRAQ